MKLFTSDKGVYKVADERGWKQCSHYLNDFEIF